MVAGPIARQQSLHPQTYKDDPLSFRSLNKGSIITARAHNSVAAPNPLLMYEALELEHKGVLLLALAPEPQDLKKEPEPTAILPAPCGKIAFRMGRPSKQYDI
jgi:hypothetical protein